MSYTDDLVFFGDSDGASEFVQTSKDNRFLFSLAISYTETCEIPGITFAGADAKLLKATPAADAEYLYYGNCKTIDKIPMTPDGKPTPALLTRTALVSSGIPHVIVDAGSKIAPKLPYMSTGVNPGRNILRGPAMSDLEAHHAVDCGQRVGNMLAAMTDCLVVGESIPGGTTTALAVLRGLGFKARVSSSMANNPVVLKNKIVNTALERLSSKDPYKVVASVGDPMIAFVTGMLISASATVKVVLAGGTQMAAILGLASAIGFNDKNTILGTTLYVLNDQSANIRDLVSEISDISAVSVDPGLAGSEFPGLQAYSKGFVKEGAGAGGAILSHMIKTGCTSARFLDLVQQEYSKIST